MISGPLSYNPQFRALDTAEQRERLADRLVQQALEEAGPQFRKALQMAKQDQKRQAALAELGQTIDAAVATFSESFGGEEASTVTQTLIRTSAVQEIEKAIAQPEIKAMILAREGQANGFGIDDGRYTEAQKLSVISAALIRGALLDAGEWMILQRGPFFHADFYERRLKELGIPFEARAYKAELEGSKARVSAVCQYTHNGERKTIAYEENDKVAGRVIDTRMVVPLNKGQGEDAAIGKACRRMLRDILQAVTRIPFKEEDEALDVESQPVAESDSEPDSKPEAEADEIHQAQRIEEFTNLFERASTLDELDDVGQLVGADASLTDRSKEILKERFRARKAYLPGGGNEQAES